MQFEYSMRQSLDRILKSGTSDGAAHLVEIANSGPEIAALAAARADDQDLATIEKRQCDGQRTARSRTSLKRILIFTFPWPKQRRTLRSVPDRFHRWICCVNNACESSMSMGAGARPGPPKRILDAMSAAIRRERGKRCRRIFGRCVRIHTTARVARSSSLTVLFRLGDHGEWRILGS